MSMPKTASPRGGVLGQDELVDQSAGVPGGGDLEGVAGLGGEGLLEVVRDVEGVVGDDGDGLGVGLGGTLLALAAGGQAQADGAGGGPGKNGAAAEGRAGPARAAGGLDAHVCLLDGSPEGPDAVCGAPGRWSRLPSPVLTGAGSRVCGCPHSQRRQRQPIGQWRPGRRRGAPLSLQVNCSSTPPADTNSGAPHHENHHPGAPLSCVTLPHGTGSQQLPEPSHWDPPTLRLMTLEPGWP